MKTRFEQIPPTEEELAIIRSYALTDEVLRIMQLLDDAEGTVVLHGLKNEATRFLCSEILYIESVDGRTFVYEQDRVTEVRHKLYELEALLRGQGFFRASKAFIVNYRAIWRVTPELSGRFQATMRNGEVVMVSRSYVPAMKEIFGL